MTWVADQKVKGMYRREFASGKASYAVKKRVGPRVLTITLGNVDSLSIEEARKKAVEALGAVVEAKADPKTGKTLQQAQDAYLKAHNEMKSASVSALKSSIKTHFSDWLEKPMSEVTREMVEARIKKIATDSAKRSKTRTANEKGRGAQSKAGRYIKALFKYAVEEDWIQKDPTQVIKAKKLVKALKRKQSYLLPSHRKALLEAIEKPEVDPGIAALVRVLMFTGCRIQEALTLETADVDGENRFLTFRDTKNGRDHVVPYSTSLDGVELPLCWKDGSPIKTPYKHLAELGKQIKFQFSPHDLRRTWATVADEIGIAREDIKACLNHISGQDVTAGYIIRSPERLRAAFQKVDDAIRGNHAQEVQSRAEAANPRIEGSGSHAGRNQEEVQSLCADAV